MNLAGNVSKPVGDNPALITLEEVETFFHEFGHGLDNLLSNITYGTTFRFHQGFITVEYLAACILDISGLTKG